MHKFTGKNALAELTGTTWQSATYGRKRKADLIDTGTVPYTAAYVLLSLRKAQVDDTIKEPESAFGQPNWCLDGLIASHTYSHPFLATVLIGSPKVVAPSF
jgi:hypothetical protein